MRRSALTPMNPPHRGAPASLDRRQLLALAAALPLGIGALSACRSSTGTPLTSDVEAETVELTDVGDLIPQAVAACDTLGSTVLADYLAQNPDANALVSPVSLTLALALLAPGATDPTAQGFDSLLGAGGEARERVWSAIQTSVNRNDGPVDDFDPKKIPADPLVHLANHVVIRDGISVKQSYLDTVQRWLTAEIEQVELAGMKANLDAWAKKHTGGLIPSSGITPNGNTILVVQNALLFAAQWLTPFSADDTDSDPFTLADGSTVDVDFMHDTRDLLHVKGENWAAIRLDYTGGQSKTGKGLALDVVLPTAGMSPASLGPETWAAASAALDAAGEPTEVVLALPKLDLKSSPKSLLAALKAQGLDDAQGFNGIAPDVRLGEFIQQVRLTLDEAGTVAAALTEAEIAATAVESRGIRFVVDHPYVLRLRDLDTGVTFLEAAIMDPTATEN